MKTFVNNPKNVLRTLVAAMAVCAALTTGVRADDVPQAHVRYGDLNLNTAVGVNALFERIRRAANEVCAGQFEGDLAHLQQTKACVARVTAQVVAAIGNPQVTRVYEQKTGTTPALELAAR